MFEVEFENLRGKINITKEGLSACALLVIFVCVLLFFTIQILKMKKKLSESREELTQIYNELAVSREELKHKYDEVSDSRKVIKTVKERLMHLEYHDALTGLMNGLSLYENFSNDGSVLEKNMLALLFVDMDNFKYINDTMGHAFGDQLIIKAGERLISLLKKGCSIYRMGGDEFIIILSGVKERYDIEVFASHVIAGFKEEFNVQNNILHISLSIGIAIYPEHGQNINELLKNADIAVCKAKGTGRNRYVVYNKPMNEAFIERMNIEKHLHSALKKNEFEIYYQPQLDLKSNNITGFEALLRWENPELGWVSPVKFIKVAEDTRLIIPLGTWILKSACAFLKKLHKKGYADLSVSVNISILQLLQNDFNDLVIDILESHDLRPDFLELEITETILIEAFEAVEEKLIKLKEKGIKIALDDFGKGYSSLCYLRQLPVSTLKIDKSFIDNVSTENKSGILTQHIIAMGKGMNMCVVAEGVEKQEQLDYLIRHECHKIQGYIFSKPISEGDMEKLLEAK